MNSWSLRYTPLLGAEEKKTMIENRTLKWNLMEYTVIPVKQEAHEFKVRHLSIA